MTSLENRHSAVIPLLVMRRGRDYADLMYYMPTIDEPGKRLLRVIQRSGVAAGWQLMSEASMTADQLSTTATSLISMGLISANANTLNPNEIGQVYFNIQPTGIQYADMVLNAR